MPFGLWEFLRLHLPPGVDAAFLFVDAPPWRSTVADMRAFLERLRVVLNSKKCIFGVEEVDFLGHIG